jgi:transposase
MYLRTVKVPSSSGKINEYVRIVEAYRENGKARQRVVADLGRKDVLAALLPKLQRLLQGENAIVDQDPASDVKILESADWGPMLLVQHLARQLGLTAIFQELLKRGHVEEDDEARAAPPAERALVLIANRLIRPGSEHALAGWLESDWVCDTAGRRFVPVWKQKGRVKVEHRQLDRWYRTLDRLAKAKDQIEVELYGRLRDLFSLKVDLVLYDITSSYFEGAGPAGLAFHGHSRDEKPHNVQVVVGVVMAGGWPIAHHVFAGNTVDVTTVQQVVKDLNTRFGLGRVVFVGDRGMVSRANLKEMTEQGQGYLVGLKRRCNPQVDGWLQKIQEQAWVACPGGINTKERAEPLRTRVQEIESGEEEMRVFVIDSDERRAYEQAQRTKCMERTLKKLEALKKRVDAGTLIDAEQIGASAQRALSAHHGQRYYAWRLENGKFEFFEDTERLDAEKRLEGKYVIGTSEKNFNMLEAVAAYKQLGEVERGFRSMKDVIAMRPIWHHKESRVKGHIFVAALALLLERLLEKRLKEAGVDNISAREAMLAVRTVRHVRFEVAGRERSGVTAGSAQARRVLAALGLSDLRPPTPPESEKTVV